jgi:hypothetical protein
LRARVHTHTRTRTQLPLLVSRHDWLVGRTWMRLHTADLESSTDNRETHGTEDALDTDLQSQLGEVVQELDHTCTDGDIGQIGDAHATLTDSVESLQIMTKMSQYDAPRKEIPLFSVMRQYMNMIMEMMFIRTGDWELHLVALGTF